MCDSAIVAEKKTPSKALFVDYANLPDAVPEFVFPEHFDMAAEVAEVSPGKDTHGMMVCLKTLAGICVVHCYTQTSTREDDTHGREFCRTWGKGTGRMGKGIAERVVRTGPMPSFGRLWQHCVGRIRRTTHVAVESNDVLSVLGFYTLCQDKL